MKPKKRIQEMTFAALLTAIAILIPSIMPIKLIIPPASYTLGSHVPLFLAMFISPWVTAFVILASLWPAIRLLLFLGHSRISSLVV